MVAKSPYADDTAIFITFDEGGGYYDSGYVQPLDFFGDGTRIPLILVSTYAKRGTHLASTTRITFRSSNSSSATGAFAPVTKRSRDNFPNPFALDFISPYVPLNSPAISDLFDCSTSTSQIFRS